MKDKKVVVFDLDDTLLYEIDFLKSAFKEIAIKVKGEQWLSLWESMLQWYYNGENVFDHLIAESNSYSKGELVDIYRNHFPQISLNTGAIEILQFCKENEWILGVITDGRSVTQRNKLKATGILSYFDKIIISEEFGTEKPNKENYKVFHEFDAKSYCYIGDNPKKDFITPNKMGWTTICLRDNGSNIHPQNFDVSEEFLPNIYISELKELIGWISK